MDTRSGREAGNGPGVGSSEEAQNLLPIAIVNLVSEASPAHHAVRYKLN